MGLFGYFANNEKDYVLRNSKHIDEVARRLEAAKEFRRFYDELKKGKEDNVNVIEYYLSVRIRNTDYSLLVLKLSFISAFKCDDYISLSLFLNRWVRYLFFLR